MSETFVASREIKQWVWKFYVLITKLYHVDRLLEFLKKYFQNFLRVIVIKYYAILKHMQKNSSGDFHQIWKERFRIWSESRCDLKTQIAFPA